MVIGHSREELDAFVQNAAILAEMVLRNTTVVRLAIRYGVPKELLVRDLHSHIGMCLAALASQIDGAALVDAPKDTTALPDPPIRKRERLTHPRHPGPHKRRS